MSQGTRPGRKRSRQKSRRRKFPPTLLRRKKNFYLKMPGQKRPRLNNYDGYLMSLLIPEEHYRFALGYQPCPGDVFLVSYPKCGNTWLMNTVYLLTHDAQPVPDDKKLFMEIPFLEFAGEKGVKGIPPPRILKSHFTLKKLVYSPLAKYICILRNPKDCCVSFFHHTKGYYEDFDFTDGTFDEFFEAFMEGYVDVGDYFDFLLDWWKKRKLPNVLVITYEWMRENNKEAIIKLGNFIGGKAAELVKDEEKVQKVLELSSFEIMRKDPDKYQYEAPFPFFRKATIGDWKNYFTSEQVERLDEKYKQMTSGTSIPKLWKKYTL